MVEFFSILVLDRPKAWLDLVEKPFLQLRGKH